VPLPSRSTVLFVHGAHMAGWSWFLVVGHLARQGISCRVLDLPLTSYDADVAEVRAALAVSAEPVHVVCHSYGGLPVAEAGHAAARLTFVAARLPRPGEVPSSVTGSWSAPGFLASRVQGPDGASRLLPAAAEHLFHRTPPALAGLAMQRARPMWSTVPDRPLARPAWMDVPATYVVCSDDRAVRATAQWDVAALVDDQVTLDSDHSPFLSCPDVLADVVAARHTVVAPA
jgi:hypothetical protein